jgi:hypothetical protein
MNDTYKLIRQMMPIVGPVLTVLALGRVFDITVGDVASAVRGLWPYVRVAKIGWLIVAVAFAYFTIVNIRHRGVPLSVVSSDITLVLDTREGDVATLSRVQRIRANREDVTGFMKEMRMSAGSVQPADIQCFVSHTDKQEIHLRGSPQNRMLIHEFDAIPRNLLRFGRNTIERKEIITARNAFMGTDEYISETVRPEYRHGRLRMRVIFHRERTCNLSDCKAFRISKNGLVRMRLTPLEPGVHGAGRGVELDIRRPGPGERFEIHWRYPS